VGPLGGQWRPLVGKVGEWYVESWHLQGCSPRLSWLRTNGLVPASKYWTYQSYAGVYGPSKPSSRMSTEAWLSPTASMVSSGEKLGMDPWITQPGWGLCWEPFFLGAVDLFKSVDDCEKDCYTWTAWDMYGLEPYVDWAWKVCDVLVGFSSVGCTSIRITVTLRYE
jgi:hypothetical protein